MKKKIIKAFSKAIPTFLVVSGIVMIAAAVGSSDSAIMAGIGEPAWTGNVAFSGLAIICAGVFWSRIRNAKKI